MLRICIGRKIYLPLQCERHKATHKKKTSITAKAISNKTMDKRKYDVVDVVDLRCIAIPHGDRACTEVDMHHQAMLSGCDDVDK